MDLALAILLILVAALFRSTFLGNHGVVVAGNQSKETIPIASQNDEVLLEMQAKSAFDKAFAKADASQKIAIKNILYMMKDLHSNTYILRNTHYTWLKEFETAAIYYQTRSERILNCPYFTPDDPQRHYKLSKRNRIESALWENKIYKEMESKLRTIFLRSNGIVYNSRGRSDFSNSASSEETEKEATDRREWARQMESVEAGPTIKYESMAYWMKSLDELIEEAITQIEQTRLDFDHAFTCLEDYLKICSSEVDICAAIAHMKRLYYRRSYIRKFIRVQIEDSKYEFYFKYADTKPDISKVDPNSDESEAQKEIAC